MSLHFVLFTWAFQGGRKEKIEMDESKSTNGRRKYVHKKVCCRTRRIKHRWEKNNTSDFEGVCFENAVWIEVGESYLVCMSDDGYELSGSIARNFLIAWVTINCSRNMNLSR